jgi:hypothetical protein
MPRFCAFNLVCKIKAHIVPLAGETALTCSLLGWDAMWWCTCEAPRTTKAAICGAAVSRSRTLSVQDSGKDGPNRWHG